MIETNSLWVASYLHEMFGSYICLRPGERPHSRLYEETLLAADIVKMGIESCDRCFLEFVREKTDTRAASLYQVIRRFPDEAVRSGAAFLIERLTDASDPDRLLPLKTGVLPDASAAFVDAGSELGRMRVVACPSQSSLPARSGSLPDPPAPFV